MLEIFYYNGSEEEESRLSSFDPSQHTLICSSLRLKKQIQQLKVSERGWLPGDAVQRAREFWQRLYQDMVPTDALIGNEFNTVLFASFMGGRPDLQAKWPRWQGLENQILSYIDQLLPLFNHTHFQEIRQEWGAELPKNKIQFLELSYEFFSSLRAHGRFFSSWCPHLLGQIDSWWDRAPDTLFFYLHSELGLEEAELIGTLSRYREVKVLAPSEEWQERYPSLFKGYKLLNTFKNKVHSAQPAPAPRQPTAERFSSTLSECKEVVAQVRRALESGTPPSQVLVMAPQIESYWGELLTLFQAEGIPVAKSEVHRLHGFYDIQLFLSRLRNSLKKFRLEDLELEVFGGSAQKFNYNLFRENSKVLLEWGDLSSLNFEEHLSGSEPPGQREVSRDEFLKWSLTHWPSGLGLERLELLVGRYLKETPPGIRFHPEQGVRYLESLAAQIEVTSSPGAPSGVQLDNLGSGSLAPYSSIFCLGLSQEAFDASERFLLSPQELRELERKFGLNLEGPHFERSDFTLEWVLGRTAGSVLFGFSESDLSGKVLSPSLPWLRMGRGKGSKIPAPTRWQWATTRPLDLNEEVGEFLRRDLGQSPTTVQLERQSVSPSGLEDYQKCPFIYLIRRGFKFSDRPDRDMDISALERGVLLHKVLELLMQDIENKKAEPDFKKVLVQAQEEKGYVPVEDEFWEFQRQSILDLAARFWAFESERRQILTKAQTVGVEVAVQGYFDWNQGKLTREPTTDSVPFTGSVDRIDGASDEVVLYDYKSTTGGIFAASNWLEKGQLQMLAYALAIEEGLSKLGPRKVVGGYYYSLKPLGNLIGFQLENHSEEVIELKKTLSPEKWQQMREGALLKMKELIQKIRGGEFDPVPRDKRDCNTCTWRPQCRAPHLT